MSEAIVSPTQHRRALHRTLRKQDGPSLPSAPQALVKLQRTLRDPALTFRKAAEVVGEDPALAAIVLRTAASPLYALSRPPRTLVQAVASIGTEELQRIAISQVALTALASTPESLDLFLKGAYANALVTRAMQRQHEPLLEPGLAWPAGLLCNIGVLLRLRIAPEEDEIIRRHMLSKQVDYAQAERDLGLMSQSTLGAQLLYAWKLPLAYVDAAFHCGTQRPLKAPGTRESLALRRVVTAADSMAVLGTARLGMQRRRELQQRVQDLLGYDEDAFVEDMAQVYALLPQVKEMMA